MRDADDAVRRPSIGISQSHQGYVLAGVRGQDWCGGSHDFTAHQPYANAGLLRAAVAPPSLGPGPGHLSNTPKLLQAVRRPDHSAVPPRPASRSLSRQLTPLRSFPTRLLQWLPRTSTRFSSLLTTSAATSPSSLGCWPRPSPRSMLDACHI